jgi:beta-galactosidase
MWAKNACMVPLLLCAALVLAASASPAAAQPTPRPAVARTFSWKGQDFLLDGKPFVIRSGEMHYPRVPRAYWRDRMRKARAMGLNTITTYVFWNLHEPKKGDFDFSGNLDVAEFVKAAQAEGLFVIVRPGPYVCTEWDLGGIPAWLLADPEMKVRTADRRFLDASRRYMAEVGKRLAPLQAGRGGNVIMVQVENEYGSFGDDKVYLQAVRKSIEDAGFDVPRFTSDGPRDTMLKGGTLPDVLSVINFGVDAKQSAKASPGSSRASRPSARTCRGWSVSTGSGGSITGARSGTPWTPRPSPKASPGCSARASRSTSTCFTAGRRSAS